MEYLPGGFTLQIPPEGFPLSTDSLVLAHFVRLPKNAKILDLGAGCGTLGLMLCARDPGCHVTGVEIDPAAHAAALENIARTTLQNLLDFFRNGQCPNELCFKGNSAEDCKSGKCF